MFAFIFSIASDPDPKVPERHHGLLQGGDPGGGAAHREGGEHGLCAPGVHGELPDEGRGREHHRAGPLHRDGRELCEGVVHDIPAEPPRGADQVCGQVRGPEQEVPRALRKKRQSLLIKNTLLFHGFL